MHIIKLAIMIAFFFLFLLVADLIKEYRGRAK